MRTRLTLARVATVLAVAAVAIAMSAAPALASNLKVSGKPPAAFIGQSYEAQLSVTGGTAPYTFTIAAGALPEGLELTPAGTIEGVPAQSGTAVFTVQVTDSSNPARSGSKKLKIKVGAHTFLSGEWQLEETRPNGEFAGREDGTLSATKASASMVKGNDFFEFPGTFSYSLKTHKLFFTIEEFEGSPVEYAGTCDEAAETCEGTRTDFGFHFTLTRPVHET